MGKTQQLLFTGVLTGRTETSSNLSLRRCNQVLFFSKWVPSQGNSNPRFHPKTLWHVFVEFLVSKSFKEITYSRSLKLWFQTNSLFLNWYVINKSIDNTFISIPTHLFQFLSTVEKNPIIITYLSYCYMLTRQNYSVTLL